MYHNAAAIEENRELFDIFDQNSSGKIDAEELQEVFKHMGRLERREVPSVDMTLSRLFSSFCCRHDHIFRRHSPSLLRNLKNDYFKRCHLIL